MANRIGSINKSVWNLWLVYSVSADYVVVWFDPVTVSHGKKRKDDTIVS